MTTLCATSSCKLLFFISDQCDKAGFGILRLDHRIDHRDLHGNKQINPNICVLSHISQWYRWKSITTNDEQVNVSNNNIRSLRGIAQSQLTPLRISSSIRRLINNVLKVIGLILNKCVDIHYNNKYMMLLFPLSHIYLTSFYFNWNDVTVTHTLLRNKISHNLFFWYTLLCACVDYYIRTIDIKIFRRT